MKEKKWMLFLLALVYFSPSMARAQIELPRVFGNGMIVQRDKPLNVWGWGDSGDAITVQFNGQTKTTTVGDGPSMKTSPK